MVTNEPNLLRFEALLAERKAGRYELLSTYIMLPAALAFSFIHSRMGQYTGSRTTINLISAGVVAVLLGVILYAKCKAEACRVRAYEKRVFADLSDESVTLMVSEDCFQTFARSMEPSDYR